MSRTKNFFYNSTTTALYQVIIVISGFITVRVMLEYYGSEINGLVSSVAQFIAYFTLVEAGLSGAAIFALYKPLADRNYKKINSIIVAAKDFYIKSGYVFLLLTIGLALFYPLYLKTNAISPINMGFLVLILGANGVLDFFTLAKYRVLLAADQKTYVISLASLTHIIINTTIIVILGTMKVDIVLLRLIALVSIFTRTAILMIYRKNNYHFLDYKEKPDYDSLNKRWDAFYLQILGVIHKGGPIILLTVIVKDFRLISVFVVFNMVTAGINGVLGIFVSGLSASFGDVIAKKEVNVLQKAYSEFEFIYYGLITLIYSVTFITIMPFIRLYTHGIVDINYNLPIIGFLFVLNGLMFNLKTPQGMLVISAGLFKETKIQTTIQGVITIIVGISLVSFLGIAGVLIGSILSNLYRDIDLLFFIPKNFTILSYKKSLNRILRIALGVLIIWVPFIFISVEPYSYINWSFIAMGISIYSLIVVVLINLIFEKKTMRSVIVRALNLVNR